MFTILDVYFINKTFQIGMNFRIRIKTFSHSHSRVPTKLAWFKAHKPDTLI